MSRYSFGQFMASPSLILQGNRDMARGTAQMNLSRQRRRTGMYSASTNNLGQPLSRRNTSQTTRSASIGGRPFSRRSLRMSRKAKRNSYRRRSSSSTSGNISRTISVAEMAAAAESAAELELAETTASIFASRAMMASERAQTQAAATVAPLHSLRSSAETTETTETTESATTTTTADVSPADFGTGLPVNAFSNRFEGNTVTNSPTYGPSFAASSADITKTNGLVPAGDLQPNANRIDTSATAAAVS
ncbi:hypothetical protein GGI12_003603 [Dipsacomyces acuminosporus]|nr:hypothetical protein GGI12_003603 [Dipsacomyces acuminosporus]